MIKERSAKKEHEEHPSSVDISITLKTELEIKLFPSSVQSNLRCVEIPLNVTSSFQLFFFSILTLARSRTCLLTTSPLESPTRLPARTIECLQFLSPSDAHQRTCEDFHFDLKNALMISQLRAKSTEDRGAATTTLQILTSMQEESAAEIASESGTDATESSGLKVLFAVLVAKTAGRAKAIVRADRGTEKGAWAWVRLRERLGTNTCATCINEVFLPVRLAEGQAVRERVAPLGQEG